MYGNKAPGGTVRHFVNVDGSKSHPPPNAAPSSGNRFRLLDAQREQGA